MRRPRFVAGRAAAGDMRLVEISTPYWEGVVGISSTGVPTFDLPLIDVRTMADDMAVLIDATEQHGQ